MLNTPFNRKTSVRIRLFASFLIFALAPSPLERVAIACTVGADLCVCPGLALHATTGAVCPYTDLQAALGNAPPQQRPPAPQQRIPVEEATKANTAESSGPRAARPELALQTGVSRPAFNVAFSPDGRLLASMDFMAGSIKLWEVSTGRELFTINLGTRNSTASGVNSPFVFSPDGSSIYSVSAGTLKQWDTRSGRRIRSLDLTCVNDIGSAYFSADARRLATTSASQSSLAVWDVGSGRKIQELKLGAHDGELLMGGKFLAFALSPDGRTLATDVGSINGAERSETLTLRDASSGRIIRTIKIPGQKTSLAPIGGDLSAQCKSADGAPLPPFTRHMRAIRFTTDGRVAIAFNDSQFVISDGRQRFTGLENKIRIWDASSGRELISLDTGAQSSGALDQISQYGAPYHFAFSNDNQQCAVVSGKNIRLFDPVAGRNLAMIIGRNDGAAVSFSSDGKLLATTGFDSAIKIWDVSAARTARVVTQERTLGRTALPVESAAFSGDGRALAVGGANSGGVWDLIAGVALPTTAIPTVTRGVDNPSAIALNNDGSQIATAAGGHTSDIRATAFSPDSRLLASVDDDDAVRLWDTATGRELATLKGHSQSVKAVAFSPDGKFLVSGSDDGSARLWDVNSGETLATLVTTGGGADWLVVTPDGLFDGTPAAWSQILWRFSPNDIFDVAPVEIFFNEYFYPGLLSDIASGKRPRAARDVEQIDRRRPSLKLSRADAQNAAGRTIKVKVEVIEPASANQAAPTGARDVRLYRNGTLVKVWRGDALNGRRQATLEAEIPIIAGENRLVAYAFNRDNVKSPAAMLTVTGDESLRRKGVAYVIAIGVNQYANPQYNLKYAAVDATCFADEIRAQQAKLQGYERVEVIRLLDCEATKANILLALKRLSNSQATLPPGAPYALSKIQPAQPEDAVGIFFAGHGAAQGERFYLIPHDLGYSGARNALDSEAMRTVLSHGVSDLELEAALEGVDAGQMLFVLDACDLGQAIEAVDKRRSPMNSSGLAQLAYEKGMYILTAAQSYQAALEAAELGHGNLTFALIEDGLKKGLADRDPKDGMALAREWFNYAEERVPQMQEREMQTRPSLDFAGNDAKAKGAKQRGVLRPRAFYRRELETRQFVVAKP